MLYDPKWEVVTKAQPDPLTLEGFVAWLEKQPPETTYRFWSCSGDCLIDRYGKAIGHGRLNLQADKIGAIFRGDKNGEYSRVCHGDDDTSTYGAALERARALL